ncbi:response regulator [Alteromonas oceanisediminis]|uniref:response regulator n=1 Tax=Alteromonas oceanisediminis TaxID=2836180 RepID=UPI001BD9E194|nr:response regulator [Alteromonas oceanisediminis]MBT0587726.1 response regulator [Alteromonas oceanisediminis]
MTKSTETPKPTVLFVDDEVNILHAVKRALHKVDIELLLTSDAIEALDILKSRHVDVIISDMKMPSMTGAALLGKAAEIQPHSFRVILSGHADADAMLSAINLGKVHRYLHKPWDNGILLDVISEGVERTTLRRENARLLALTQAQNQKLRDNNAELEKKVSLRTKQIKQALTNIDSHNKALGKVLYNVIVKHPHIDGKFARQVSESAQQLATALGLSESERHDIGFAGLICELGLVGLTPDILLKPFNELNYEQQQLFLSQADLARLILAPVSDWESKIHLIAHQFDRVNQTPEPPAGARIISICRDYWRYRLGRITAQPLTALDARNELTKYAGVRYDSHFLKTFIQLDIRTLEQTHQGRMRSQDLAPGMVLKFNLFNEQHILLLPEGHVFTESSIQKLKQFERGHGTEFTLDIQLKKTQSPSDQENEGT